VRLPQLPALRRPLSTRPWAGAPAWALLVSSGLAGAATPQLGSMVRARWSALLGGSPLLHAAFSLESVADEVIFVAGPVLVTLLATQVHPASGIGVAVATCVVSTLWLAGQRLTEPRAARPARRRRRARAAAPAGTCCPHPAWPRWHRCASSSGRCSPRSTWPP